MNKKGITPLVATVLLVAFSVGLGALVMSWGEEYIEEKAEFVQGTAEVGSGCDATSISVIRIGGLQQVCLEPGAINVWLDNGPSTDLFNIHARIAGVNGVVVKEEILSAPLLKSNAAKAIIPYDPSIGQVLQLKLTPKLWTGADIATCAQSSITIEEIPPC